MKASFTLGPAIDRAIIIMVIIGVVVGFTNPTIAQADNSLRNSGEPALVFEVKNLPTPNHENTDQSSTIQNSPLTAADLGASDPMAISLRQYLEKHKSPLAEYADEIIWLPQWQRALAISYQESNFGRRCLDNNCSGIGGSPQSPNWRKYPNKLEWFKDMTKLMERPMYKEKFTNCHTMNGVYNAGSHTWLNSCVKKSAELISLTHSAQQERLAMISDGRLAYAAISELSLK